MLKGHDEIRRILTSELGFTSLATYREWIERERPRYVPTDERVALLSPEAIDNRAFWRVCQELFGVDPVCNLVIAPKTGSHDVAIDGQMDANRANLKLAKVFGITAMLEEFAQSRLKVFEIGPGFGALKNHVETFTNHIYLGVDVMPRIDGVVETTAEGLISDEVLSREREQQSYVVATNVFQHLSARQRSRYYSDAHALLKKGGLFMFNLFVDHGSAFLRDARGVAWCDHYGQLTRIPKAAELHAELQSLFDVLYVTRRYDSVVNFVCQKRL